MKLQSNSACTRGILAALAYVFLSACVSQSVPNHGGGKRFYYEQALLVKATDSAVEQIDFTPVMQSLGNGGAAKTGIDEQASAPARASQPINVHVIAMGDAGGGYEASSSSYGSSLFSGSLTGSGGAKASSQQASSSSASGSHAFANAHDLEYLRTKVLVTLAAKGITSADANTKDVAGDLYLLVSEYGTNKEGFNLLVYSEASLEARVAMEGFFLAAPAVKGDASVLKPLGKGECTTEYLARYIFGAGPVGGARIKIMPGPIQAKIVLPGSPESKPTRSK